MGGRRAATIPPVMIVVCNETKMAEMLEKHIAERGEAGPWLENRDGRATVHRADRLEAARRRRGARGGRVSTGRRRAAARAGRDRRQAGAAGRAGPLPDLRRMLSEGWDARNVTQILGLRAFQSPAPLRAGGRPRAAALGLHATSASPSSSTSTACRSSSCRSRGRAGRPSSRRRRHRCAACASARSLRLEFPRVEQIISDLGDVVDGRPGCDRADPRLARERPERDLGRVRGRQPRQGDRRRDPGPPGAYEHFRLQRLVFRLAADLVTDIDKREQPWLFPQMARRSSAT